MVPYRSARLATAAHLLRASSDAFVTLLSGLPEEAITRGTRPPWSAAGHAFHVALTNEVFSGVIRGTGPLKAFEGSSDFPDDRWSYATPPFVEAPALLIPPAGVQPAAAIDRLRETSRTLAADIERLHDAEGRLCVQLPWGVVSLVQMSEWAAGHTLRHISHVGRDLQQAAAVAALA